MKDETVYVLSQSRTKYMFIFASVWVVLVFIEMLVLLRELVV